MTCNIGGVERAIRIVLGVLFLALALLGGMPTAGAWVLGIIGAIALVTGGVGFCPGWQLFGINTCSTKPTEKKT